MTTMGRMRGLRGLGCAGAVAGLMLGAAGAAEGVPLRAVKMIENDGDSVAARADLFLPPDAKYCHAFVRSYLVAPGPDRWRIVGRYGKFKAVFTPCADGTWDGEQVSVRFADTAPGTRKICFEAWTILRGGAISRHYACTGSFTR